MIINKPVYIRQNTAKANGGGVYLYSGTIEIASGVTVTIDNAAHSNPTLASQSNSATNGGGIYLNGGTFTNNGTLTVNNNTASADGGGLYLNGGTFDNKGTLAVAYNTASTNGGGIYNKSTFTVSGGDFWLGSHLAETSNYGNKAVDGAGLYQAGGTFSMTCNALKMGDNSSFGVP